MLLDLDSDPVGDLFFPGAKIDRYALIRHVATGGMGSVWEAQLDGKHGFAKRVAIKTIRAELAGELRFRQMFLEEARLSSRLSHANVAQVLDVGDHESTVYIVFEWVDGRSLESTCLDAAARGTPVSIEQTLRIVADVCAGLHAVHELRGDSGEPLQVVHRDVSPHNVLVSPEGFAKIIDFGLAKAKDRAFEATKSGVVRGTPQFMSPEQALGRPLDPRADVFAAGAVLFRALAGCPPFPHREALVKFVLDGQLPDLPQGVPESVRALIAKAMHRDPGERFADAAEMRRAIERTMHLELPSSAAVVPQAAVEGPAPATAVEAVAGLALAATEHAAVASTPRARIAGTKWLVVGVALVACLVLAALVLALRL